MYRLPRPVSPMYRLPLTPRFAHAVIYSTTIRGGRAGRLIGQVSRQVMRNGGRPGLDNRTVPSSGGGATPRGPPSRVLPGPCSRSNPYRRANPWPPCPELPRGPNTTQSPPKPPVPRAHPWPPVPPGSPLASCTGSPGASPFPTGSHVPPQVARFHRGTPSRSNPWPPSHVTRVALRPGLTRSFPVPFKQPRRFPCGGPPGNPSRPPVAPVPGSPVYTPSLAPCGPRTRRGLPRGSSSRRLPRGPASRGGLPGAPPPGRPRGPRPWPHPVAPVSGSPVALRSGVLLPARTCRSPPHVSARP